MVLGLGQFGVIAKMFSDQYWPSTPSKYTSLTVSTLAKSKSQVGDERSSIWTFLKPAEKDQKLVAACNEGDVEYLREHVTEASVSKLFEHLLSSHRDLGSRIQKVFSQRNQAIKENLVEQKEALKGSLIVLFEKASFDQKIAIVSRLVHEDNETLLDVLKIDEQVIVEVLGPIFDTETEEYFGILSFFFEQYTDIIVENFSDEVNFIEIYDDLDLDLKTKVVLSLFKNKKDYENCLSYVCVPDRVFFEVIFSWNKYESYEGSHEFLESVLKKVDLESYTGQMTEVADQYLEQTEISKKCIHVAILVLSNPSLSPHLKMLLPLISDHAGLIQIACEHGNLEALKILISKTKLSVLSVNCLMKSAEFGHLNVVQHLLADLSIKFVDQRGVIVEREKAMAFILFTAAEEDDRKMVAFLLKGIYQQKEIFSKSIVIALKKAAMNRRDRTISFTAPREALLAIKEFCLTVGYKFPIKDLQAIKDIAEYEALDPSSARILGDWIQERKKTLFLAAATSSKQISISR